MLRHNRFFQIYEWRKNGIGIYGGGEMMF